MKEDMDHRATAPASAPIGQAAAGDASPIAKGDPEIMRRLLKALSYRRNLPAFSRRKMVYDFDLGRVK